MVNLKKPIIIAIDGHSSCGKSSFAKLIAKKLGYLYVDSGAMYRAVTLYALRNELISEKGVNISGVVEALKDIEVDFRFNTAKNQYETYLNGENVESEIRTMAVSKKVSEISTIKEVRQRLVALQQKFGEKKGIVMDGRDIGTVVYPSAELKLFMTASIDVRAERRHKELLEKGTQSNIEEVKKNLSQRDYIDQNRDESPLRKAEDAILLDNSNLTFESQMEWFENLLKENFN
jgi:CMP/dCMP kinase